MESYYKKILLLEKLKEISNYGYGDYTINQLIENLENEIDSEEE